MKKTIRSLSLALVFTMLAVVTPLLSSGGMKVSAANGFNIDSNGVLTSYTGSETEVEVPDKVTAIGANAFNNNTSITGVYLPISVKKIGNSAFYGCSNLQNVLIGSGVETIENYAFNGCEKLDYVSLSYVKKIGQSAFLRCPALQSLYIPTETQFITVPFCSCPVSVSSYNPYFAERDGVLFNKNFTKLVYCPQEYESGFYCVPASVKTIGTFAFYSCENIEAVAIPKNVTTLEDCIFGNQVSSNHIAIKDVYYGGTLSQWNSLVSGKTALLSGMTVHCGYEIENGVLTSYTGTDKEVEIPDGVTAIGASAFENNTSVTGVYLPISVKKIGNSAFFGCSNLQNFMIGSGVETIENYAFNNCVKLDWISLSHVKTIGQSVFLRCPALQSLYIPTETQSITVPFCDCPVSVSSYNQYFTEKNGILFNKDCTKLLYCPAGYEKSFYRVPANISTIGTFAFFKCRNLTAIAIPKTVSALEDNILGNNVSSNNVAVKDIYYGGSKAQWDSLKSGKDIWLGGVTVHFNCDIAEGKPIIAKQPEGAFVELGDLLSLSVEAAGNDLSYQWYFKKEGQTEFSAWNNRTKATEDVYPNATWNNIQLYCKVTDGSTGKSVNSATVKITVLGITTQPKSQTVTLGKSLTVSVKAVGNGLTYQWYYKKKGQTEFSVWNGRTKASETVTPNDTWNGIQLQCIVTDGAGNSVGSNIATVTVTSALKITQQPGSQTIALGDSITLSVKAEGSGLKYQWHFKKKGQTSFSVWNGRTHASETVTPNDSWDGIQLYCKVADGAGNSVNSSTATITISSGITITQQPKNQSIIAGKSLTLSVKATGSGLKYQWYFKKKGQSAFSVWNNRTKATETVSPNNTWDSIQLYCKITDANGNSVNSATVTISVLSITTHPKSQTVTLGNSVTLSVKATGSGLSYQWYYKKKGASDWSVWNGRTKASETVTPNASWNGIQLYCVVKDSAGNTVKSETATITVK